MALSITSNLVQLIATSRHLILPNWLSLFSRLTPYLLWAGLLVIFAAVIVRDRSRK